MEPLIVGRDGFLGGFGNVIKVLFCFLSFFWIATECSLAYYLILNESVANYLGKVGRVISGNRRLKVMDERLEFHCCMGRKCTFCKVRFLYFNTFLLNLKYNLLDVFVHIIIKYGLTRVIMRVFSHKNVADSPFGSTSGKRKLLTQSNLWFSGR